MVSSRRVRLRKEGTFLESVKLLLQELKDEVAIVKTSIQSLVVGGSQNHAPDIGAFWNDADIWNAMGFEQSADHVHIQDDVFSSSLRAAAPAYFPAYPPASTLDVISRDAMLLFRLQTHEKDETCLTACYLDEEQSGNKVLVRKGRRRKRPSAKTRRRLRRQQLLQDGPRLEHAQTLFSTVADVDYDNNDDDDEAGLTTQAENCTDLHVVSQPSNDLHEMILPISQGVFLSSGCQPYPLPLQRHQFFSCLPANRELLQAVEQGFEAGSAYRHEWRELPSVCKDREDDSDIESVDSAVNDAVDAIEDQNLDTDCEKEQETDVRIHKDACPVDAVSASREVLLTAMEYAMQMLRSKELPWTSTLHRQTCEQIENINRSLKCATTTEEVAELQALLDRHMTVVANIFR